MVERVAASASGISRILALVVALRRMTQTAKPTTSHGQVEDQKPGSKVNSRGPGVMVVCSYCISLSLIMYSVSLKIYILN